eukprot:TRINITY_DN44722_c0_g1_i1.p1 TRINITY_DN44722_c0_g1~~TRINITY_DN44722_c0_g1_i1.p1  ORF type:complete len:594 (+),score=38.69 TRINITY_DN44722_c0_g1_i1:47-1828(+)
MDPTCSTKPAKSSMTQDPDPPDEFCADTDITPLSSARVHGCLSSSGLQLIPSGPDAAIIRMGVELGLVEPRSPSTSRSHTYVTGSSANARTVQEFPCTLNQPTVLQGPLGHRGSALTSLSSVSDNLTPAADPLLPQGHSEWPRPDLLVPPPPPLPPPPLPPVPTLAPPFSSAPAQHPSLTNAFRPPGWHADSSQHPNLVAPRPQLQPAGPTREYYAAAVTNCPEQICETHTWWDFLVEFLRFFTIGGVWCTVFAIMSVGVLYYNPVVLGLFRLLNTAIVIAVIFCTAHLMWPLPARWFWGLAAFAVLTGVADLLRTWWPGPILSFVINSGFVITSVVCSVWVYMQERTYLGHLRPFLMFLLPWACAQITVLVYDLGFLRFYRSRPVSQQMFFRLAVFPVLCATLLLVTKYCARRFRAANNPYFLVFSFVALKVIFGRMLISSTSELWLVAVMSFASAFGEVVQRAVMAFAYQKVGFFGFQSTALQLISSTFEQLMEMVCVVSVTVLDATASIAKGRGSLEAAAASLAIQVICEVLGDLVSFAVEYHFRANRMFSVWCQQPRYLMLWAGLYVIASACLSMPRIAAHLTDRPTHN